MRERGIELSEKNVGAIANELRALRGMDAIAQMCIPAVRALPSSEGRDRWSSGSRGGGCVQERIQ